MAKFECQLNERPSDVTKRLGDELRRRGRVLTDSSAYSVGGILANFQVWERLSLLVIGSGKLTTVTAVSELPEDIGFIETGLGM